jgi:hypothetical protein
MEIVSTQELITKATQIAPQGYELSIRIGILNCSRAVFFRKNMMFHFDIQDDYIFKKSYGYTVQEFLEHFKEYRWIIEALVY